MGILKIDSRAQVVDFVEKPKEVKLVKSFRWNGGPQYLGSMGIYVSSSATLSWRSWRKIRGTILDFT